MKKLRTTTVAETEYHKFFRKKLEDYGVDSPSQLEDKDKEKFFNEVENEWKGEKSESARRNPEDYADYYGDPETVALLAAKLSKATGIKVSGGDYIDWMEDSSPKFHKAVLKFLGKETYNYYFNLARVGDALDFHLGLTKDKYASGIDVSYKIEGDNGLKSLNPKAKILKKKK